MSITKSIYLPLAGHYAHFTHRDHMNNPYPLRRCGTARSGFVPPKTVLPVDCTGNGTCSVPMYGNDQYGDCGPAMSAHYFGVNTFGRGQSGWTEWIADEEKLIKQYLKVSGGDNGTDEDEMVNQVEKVGDAGDPSMVIINALDINITDIQLAQFCIDYFNSIQMAWSVPDAFIRGFAPNTVWPSSMTPDPNNGHFTLVTDVGGPATPPIKGQSLSGFNRMATWGGFCWIGPDFIASVEPQCFVVFSGTQFSKSTGLDAKGRHITAVAAAWVSVGGNPVPQALINSFPPADQPVPVPTPSPVSTFSIPATSGYFDPASKVFHIPTGWSKTENPFNDLVVIDSDNQIVNIPSSGWTLK